MQRGNCKCDYCGHHDFNGNVGSTCPKCHKGVMCERGGRGWPAIYRRVRK